MHIVESLLQGKRPDQSLCEDGLFVGDSFVAVIDGVTSKGQHQWGGRSSGACAKDVILDYLQGHAVAGSAPEKVLSEMSDALRRRILQEGISQDRTEWLRACIVAYDDVSKLVWSYGDCQCLVGDERHCEGKLIDKLNAEERAFWLEGALIDGATERDLMAHDVGREHIHEALVEQFKFENRNGPFGYPVLNGTPIVEGLIRTFPVVECETVVLASDGYPRLESTLAESEEYLSSSLEADPLCYRLIKSTKGIAPGNQSYDDRCYCRIDTSTNSDR